MTLAEVAPAPPHFPVPSVMYGLESVAAAFFYAGVVLGVIGAMGLARASVEGTGRATVPAMLVAAALTCAGLAIVCYIASPRHILPF